MQELESKPAQIISMDILGTVGGMAIDFKYQYVYLSGNGMLAEDYADCIPTARPRPKR